MLSLRKIRRSVALSTAAIALAAGASIATPGTAFADSGTDSWAAGACQAGDYFDSNHLTGTVSSPYGHQCQALIMQNGSSVKYSNFTWGSTVFTPTYWRGWGASGTFLQDTVCAKDFTISSAWVCGPTR